MAGLSQIAMVAGEASGDMLGAHLLAGMQGRWRGLRKGGAAVGIGGQHLTEAGLQAWWPSERLAVRGYVEVLRHYRGIVGIRRQLTQRLLADKPQVFIGVDAPDFNLELELTLRQSGIKTVHFISPSIWAWRPERIEKIRAACDAVLCIFPFEPALYANTGVSATYVGHPLAQVIPEHTNTPAAKRALGLDEHAPVLAVLPGSRASEIQYLGQRMVQAVAHLLQAEPQLQIVVPCANGLRDRIESLTQGMRVKLLNGQSHAALAACDITLIASGTATLEAALFQKPMVIAYNMHPISWWMMQRKRLQPWVGLPNILCADAVVPELLQNQATPHAMAQAVQGLLHDAPRRAHIAKRFGQLHQQLRRDTVQLACNAIEHVI